MPSTKNRRRGNVIPDAKSNDQQTNNCCATGAENKEFDHPVVENKENVQIKQLQDKIEELEKEITQYKIQIKNLEDKVMRK
jgi:predicted RNase H-like nuclease (RuvC/YqgF family)